MKRKEVAFTVDKHGKPIAYRVTRELNGFVTRRMGLEEARMMVATGEAEHVAFRRNSEKSSDNLRRNPDIIGTVLVLGAVGVGGYFLYQAVKGTIGGTGIPTPSAIGNQGGSAIGSGAAGTVAGAIGGALSDSNLCTLIAQWRNQGAPIVTLAAIGGSSFGNIGGGDPHNYGNFTTWAEITTLYIVPNSPPSCW